MGERFTQVMAGAMAVFLAWVLQSMMSSLQMERQHIYSLLDRVSALEQRVEAMHEEREKEK